MPPRQYLTIPQEIAAEQLLSAFQKEISENDIACVLVDGDTKDILSEKITTLKKTAHQNDIAILIKDQFKLVTELGIDGVHITANADQVDTDQVKTAREALGPDYIVGAQAVMSRHRAMQLGEQGADYIAFSGGTDEQITEMCAWWTPLFQIPCVAFFAQPPQNINDNNIIDFYSASLRV